MKTKPIYVGAAVICSLTCLMTAGGSFPGAVRKPGAPKPAPGTVTLYDPHAEHLWNQLHQALLVRTTPEGKALGQDEIDPLLWPQTRHLLVGPSHAKAIRLLDDFLMHGGEKQIRDPLKRAVLQHDLWTVFEWTAFPYGSHQGTEKYTAARRALQRRLAQAIRRLAFPSTTIAALPDNYAAAVKSRGFAAGYDPAHPARPFLPGDLFAPGGPWVCVGGPLDGPAPVALTHTHFFSGRSIFLISLHLPGGRKSTLAYLKKLNNVPSPWVLRKRKPDDAFRRRELLELTPDLPQFPVGTQVALVRQMVLLSDAGTLVASPLTESVQLRVYRRVNRVSDSHDERRKDQSFVELALGRPALFAGKAGGLHAVAADQPAYLALQFLTGYDDPFEKPAKKGHSFLMPVLETCVACHASESGIYSVNSFTHRFSRGYRPLVDLALWPSNVMDERRKVLEWKRDRYDWGLLQGLWAR